MCWHHHSLLVLQIMHLHLRHFIKHLICTSKTTASSSDFSHVLSYTFKSSFCKPMWAPQRTLLPILHWRTQSDFAPIRRRWSQLSCRTPAKRSRTHHHHQFPPTRTARKKEQEGLGFGLSIERKWEWRKRDKAGVRVLKWGVREIEQVSKRSFWKTQRREMIRNVLLIC